LYFISVQHWTCDLTFLHTLCSTPYLSYMHQPTLWGSTHNSLFSTDKMMRLSQSTHLAKRACISLCLGNWLKTYCQWQLQPLPDLHKGCVPQTFMQVKFYKSRNFPRFNFLSRTQEKLWKCASKCAIKRLRQVAVQKRT
jgi:hypothetical protein